MANPILKLSVNSTFQSDPARGHELPVAPGFGIRSDGTAYYRPGGAVAGEAAWVRLDSSGLFKLEQDAPALLFGLIEGDARPVELGEHVTGPVTEKDGATVVAPVMRAVEPRSGRAVDLGTEHVPHVVPPMMLHPDGRDGRPVHVAALRTPKLRRGRPVKVARRHQTLALHHGLPLDLPEPRTLDLRDGRPVALAEHQTLAIKPDTRVRTS